MSCRCAICRGDHLTKDHEYPELTLRPYPDDIQDCYNAFAEWNEFGGSKSGGRSLPEHIAIRVALAARRKAAAIPRSDCDTVRCDCNPGACGKYPAAPSVPVLGGDA